MLILYFVILILMLAFVALWNCAETVYTSVSKVWLRECALEGDLAAKQACHLLDNADKFLGTILMGNNLVVVTFVTVFRLLLMIYVVNIGAVQHIMAIFHCSNDVLTTVISTPIVLVFGEILPKAVARNHSEVLALKLAGIITWFQKMLWPLVFGIVWISKHLIKVLSKGMEPKQKSGVTRDDLRVMAEMVTEQGLVGREVGDMLQMVLTLENKTVEAVMVPLVEVRSVSQIATVAEVERLTVESGFTRFPVYAGRVDEIVGVVSLRKMERKQRRMGISDKEFSVMAISSFVDPSVLYVPETRKVNSLLDELRHHHLPMAIVIDEYGGMTGMVTIEDLAGQIIGNIQDEREGSTVQVKRIDDRTFECDGKLDIRELEKWLGFSIRNVDFETAAGLILKLRGCIPELEESLDYKGYKVSVISINKHRITKLRFSKKQGK